MTLFLPDPRWLPELVKAVLAEVVNPHDALIAVSEADRAKDIVAGLQAFVRLATSPFASVAERASLSEIAVAAGSACKGIAEPETAHQLFTVAN